MKNYLFLILFYITLFGGYVHVAEAVSWKHLGIQCSSIEQCYESHIFNVSVNTNKTTYAPGENIIISGYAGLALCSNSGDYYSLRATLAPYHDVYLANYSFVYGYAPAYPSVTITAPPVPGTYNINLKFESFTFQGYSYNTIPITVVAPAPQAAVGTFESAASSTCSVRGWAYDPDNVNSSIDVAVYRDNDAASGGVLVTTCPANQLRPDINASQGITGNHGFDCTLPASYQFLGDRSLYIHALDVNGTPNNLLTYAPKNLSCAPPAPTASISATPCLITEGNSTCSGGQLTWSSSYVTNPLIRLNGAVVYSTEDGINEPATLNYGNNQVSISEGATELDTTTVFADCDPSAPHWNSSYCQVDPVPPAPIVSVIASQDVIRSGNAAALEIEVNAPYPVDCSIQGGVFPDVFTHDGDVFSPTSSFTVETKNLTSAQVFMVTCAPSPVILGISDSVASTTVRVIPTVQEI